MECLWVIGPWGEGWVNEVGFFSYKENTYYHNTDAIESKKDEGKTIK